MERLIFWFLVSALVALVGCADDDDAAGGPLPRFDDDDDESPEPSIGDDDDDDDDSTPGALFGTGNPFRAPGSDTDLLKLEIGTDEDGNVHGRETDVFLEIGFLNDFFWGLSVNGVEIETGAGVIPIGHHFVLDLEYGLNRVEILLRVGCQTFSAWDICRNIPVGFVE